MGCCSSKPEVDSVHSPIVEREGNEPVLIDASQSVKIAQVFESTLVEGSLDDESGCVINYTANSTEPRTLPSVKSGIASIECKTGSMKIISDGQEVILNAGDEPHDFSTNNIQVVSNNGEQFTFTYKGYPTKKQAVVEEEKVKGFIDQEKVSLETEKHIIDHKDNIALKGIEKEDEHLLLLLLNDLKSSINLVDFIFPLKKEVFNIQKYISANKTSQCFIIYCNKNPCGVATIIHNTDDINVLEISYMISSSIQEEDIGKNALLLVLHFIKKNIPCKSIGIKVYSRNRLCIELLKSLGFAFNNSIDNPNDPLRGTIDCYLLPYDNLDMILKDF